MAQDPISSFIANQCFSQGDIIQECFIRPVVDPSVQGYNIVNSIVYFGLLFIIAFAVLWPVLNKRGLKFNLNFALSLLPYILFGVSLRVINTAVEAGVLALPGVTKTPYPWEIGYWMFTPGVWFLTFGVVLIGMLAAHRFAKNASPQYYKILAGIGSLAALPFFLLVLSITKNPLGLLMALAVIGISVGVTYFLFQRFTPWKVFESKLNLLAMTGQALDAGATFVAISFFSFGEQHPLSGFILGANPVLFILVKLALITYILHVVDKEYPKENLNGYIKIVLMVLGFATGGASFLKIGIV